ncbi:diguanylate cyclase (GGDEF) domain-containing protein [Paraburkholderia phenazinium]|jgi:diguanylate cyclase (GGDEF)-like protein|uniref:diguanylate cyclase n=2 Tax=Paraburkholderia phenazinium TaxID=60549 RepID=A0A1G8A448_9BURK|nr:diguanylate cyclase (GGDEF) domain-containing protein [Paraburkholderia phenazinium]
MRLGYVSLGLPKAFHMPFNTSLTHPVKRRMNSSIMSLAVSRHHRIAACGVAGLILCVVLAVLPVASLAAPKVAAFLPLFAMAVFTTEGLTAYLLWTQFLITRGPFLGALAGAYGYTAVTVAIQLLVFPGVFSPTGLLGAGPQSAVWIWAFWHGGSPVLILAALYVRQRFPNPLPRAKLRLAGFVLVGGPVCLSLLLCTLAIHGAVALPQLVDSQSYQRLRHSPSGIGIVVLSAGALLYLVNTTRLRTLLELWLGVALFAGFGDVIVTLVANERYSVGWYVARLESVLASSTVLGVLIWEISHLYRELHAANARLAEYASRDGLTGIFNRRYFEERYPVALAQANMAQRALSILMVDIDHFKRFNDTFGHLHGDECLASVAGALQADLPRNDDFVARFGGEEFVIVLPDCEREMAARIADRLHAAVARLGVAAPFTEVGSVSVSIGVATSPPNEPIPAAELLAHADAALYRAKEAGRNRVNVWHPAPLPHTLGSSASSASVHAH